MIPPADYVARVKFIRPYTTGFSATDGYDLRSPHFSSAQKTQINKYYKAVRALTSRSHYIYHPRKKSNLSAVLKSTGVGHLKKFRVGILQVPTELTEEGEKKVIKPQIRVTRSGKVKIKIKNIMRDTLLFSDYGYSEIDVAMYSTDIIDEIVSQNGYKYYSIIAGEYEVGKGVPRLYTPDKVKEEIAKLIEAYSATNFDPNNSSSSYFGNWLFGLNGYNFSNVNQAANYLIALRDYKTRRDKISGQIKNAKIYKEKLLNKVSEIKRSKKISQKKKDKLLEVKYKQIEKQRLRINKLIVQRTKI